SSLPPGVKLACARVVAKPRTWLFPGQGPVTSHHDAPWCQPKNGSCINANGAPVPHARAFAVSAIGLALFVTNNELAIAAVRHPEEAGSALSLLGTVSVRWVGIARR